MDYRITHADANSGQVSVEYVIGEDVVGKYTFFVPQTEQGYAGADVVHNLAVDYYLNVIEPGVAVNQQLASTFPQLDVYQPPNVPTNLFSVEQQVKLDREAKMIDADRKILQVQRDIRLGKTPKYDIELLDQYMELLCQIPEQSGYPNEVEWPVDPY